MVVGFKADPKPCEWEPWHGSLTAFHPWYQSILRSAQGAQPWDVINSQLYVNYTHNGVPNASGNPISATSRLDHPIHDPSDPITLATHIKWKASVTLSNATVVLAISGYYWTSRIYLSAADNGVVKTARLLDFASGSGFDNVICGFDIMAQTSNGVGSVECAIDYIDLYTPE